MMDNSTKTDSPPDYTRSSIAWFGEMVLADDRGDFPRAAEAQKQLTRLGWRVRRNQGTQTAERPGQEVARG